MKPRPRLPRREARGPQRPKSSTAPSAPIALRAPTTARDLALVVLSEYKASSAFIASLLDRHAPANLSAPDRALAAEIAYGVVRRQAALEAILQTQIKRPRHQIEGQLCTLLEIGAYQLVFLPSMPTHAAVFETVEIARRIGQPRWSGFANGVLRGVERMLTTDTVDAPAADAIPVDGGRYRRSSVVVFPEPAKDPCGYVASAFSFPRWLIDRWQARFEMHELLRICFWFNARPAITLRTNLLRTTRAALLEAFQAAGVGARAGAVPDSIYLNQTMRVESLPGFGAGWFSVQDESAMRAAPLLAPEPGQRVLDVCAAPGTKTTHLAECMRNSGSIVGTDIRAERLALVEQNSARLGLDIIETKLVGEDGTDLPSGPFDAVLVDVPCSNTGVLAKRPEVRWRLSPQDLAELPRLQLRLLQAACERTRPGGRVLYSTCSLEPEENQQVVRSFLRSRPDVRLVEEVEHVPGLPADGGYQALLQV